MVLIRLGGGDSCSASSEDATVFQPHSVFETFGSRFENKMKICQPIIVAIIIFIVAGPSGRAI